MGILNIRPVEGGKAKGVIGIAGISGSGKTLTALLIARGMVDHPSQIGFLDTENKRGSLYHDALDGQFQIADLIPPFSPSRFAEAIKEFQNAGVKVLIIDSVSHEWEGTGGCEEIANSPKADGTPRKVADWNGAKREHKKFMNVLLHSNMHIIPCIRARNKTDFKDPTKPIDLGLQPVCEKNFMFELTASVMMYEQGTKQDFLKVPNALKKAFGTGNGYLGIETGKAIRSWLENGLTLEVEEIMKIKSEALLICEQGTEALTKLWKSIDKKYKENEEIKTHFSICGESAKAYEQALIESDEVGKLEYIKNLFESKKESMNEIAKEHVENVIANNIESDFDKVIFNLKKVVPNE